MSNRLFQSTLVVSAMTLISRILGFARDVLFAVLFGATAGMDAFLVAFKIPNFMRRLFAEGAFAQAFVPVLTEEKTTRDQASVRDLVAVASGTLATVLTLISVIGVLAAPLLILIFAPGFYEDPAKYQLASDMLRWTFPYLLFISLTALAGGVLNAHQRFAVPAFTPVLLNVSLIGAALLLAPRLEESVFALAIGVFIAGVLQLLFQFPFLRRIGMLPMPRWGWKDSRVRKILVLMTPILIGSSMTQISLLLDTLLASFLITGSVSWLYFSDRLMEFPLGIFSIAVATVALPHLSAKHAAQSTEQFSTALEWALKLTLIIGLPAALGLFLLAGPMLSTLFQYDAFDALDVEMSRMSLMAYSLGFIGFSLVKVLIPGYYARQDSKTPLKFASRALLLTMVLNVALVTLWMKAGWQGAHTGLALATSIGACANAWQLYHGLRSEAILKFTQGWGVYLLRIFFANAAMIAILLWLTPDLPQWFAWSLSERSSGLLGLIGAAAVVYFASLFISGLRPRHLGQPV